MQPNAMNPMSNPMHGGAPQGMNPMENSQPPAPRPAHSTAPQRAAAPVIEGLPVPWPNPTATQTELHHNPATRAANDQVNAMDKQALWIPSADEIGVVKGGMDKLVALYANTNPVRRVLDDTKKKINSLVEALESG